MVSQAVSGGGVGREMAFDDRWRATGDDWAALLEPVLRGRGFETLVGATRDGIEVHPLYTDGPARPAAVRGAADPGRAEQGWDIRARHGAGPGDAGRVGVGGGRPPGDMDALRSAIADDLAGGATSIELDLGALARPDLDRLLAPVDLGRVPVALAPHADLGTAECLAALAARRRGAAAPGGSLGLDPVGEWARTGRLVDVAPAASWVASAAGEAQALHPGTAGTGAAAEVRDGGPILGGRAGAAGAAGAPVRLDPGVRAFTVDATRYADAGATEAQCLAWATATGIAYLRALVAAGLSVDAAAGLIGFRLAATADQSVTIAALRATRVMWHRVVTASGGSAAAARQYQHAVTAAHMYSRRDPWVNLLRATAAALAAGVAGADAVTVLSFDHASGPPGRAGAAGSDAALGRRLARNTQLLLVKESHLARSADPAGGSFHVESLTDELAREGWRTLQAVEAAGGMAAAITGGSVAAAIDERWQARAEGLRTRREGLVGVSEFPLLDDAAPAPATDAEPAPAIDTDAASAIDAAPAPAIDTDAVPATAGLPVRRLAQPFEDLRDAADRQRIATGTRPAVWVAALGPAAAHSSRTAWAQNLLAVGGIGARGGEGVESPVAAAADFAASGLAAAVITGTDGMYQQRARATGAALADAGATYVAIVCDPGTPAERLQALESAGIDDVWHQGMDVVAILKRLHAILGVA